MARVEKEKTGNPEVKGIRCSACGSDQVGVIDSRPKKNGMRWRRYRCWKCGNRQSTLEMDFGTADNLIKMLKIVEKITGVGK